MKIKTMNKYEIIQKIENFAPPQTAEKWDCVGFMVETKNIEVSKIMLCLTPTTDIIKQALEQNCQMIISHHPMFKIECTKELLTNKFEPKIDIYSAHTNLDKAQGGTTDTLIKTVFPLSQIQRLENNEFLRMIELETPISIEEFKEKLIKISPNLRYTNNKDTKFLKKITFCAGSGSEFIEEATELGADCLVTGDLKFHAALDSKITVFDIGHFESEILILPEIKKLISEDVEIVFAKENSPFKK
jgi:dinuclear metal center YbgI/SA1388 family protein